MLEFLLAVANRRAGRLVRDSAAPQSPRFAEEEEDPAVAELADLEARKEAKYRQIRDAEADRAAGKLTEEDFSAARP